MSLGSFNSIPQTFVQNMYYQTKSQDNGKEYAINPQKQDGQLQKLDEMLKKGEISEEKYDKLQSAIKSAPDVLHVDEGSSVPQKSRLKDAEDQSSSIDKLYEKEYQMQKSRLEQQYKNGEISEFAYRANSYMLSHPMPQQNNITFSTTA